MKPSKTSIAFIAVLILVGISFSLLAPLSSFKYIMTDVVGMSPTGYFDAAGKYTATKVAGATPLSWEMGFEACGGRAMRIMAALGSTIFCFALLGLFKAESFKFPARRKSSNVETVVAIALAATSFAILLALGTSWWDETHFLYFGKTFPIMIGGMAILGAWPLVAKNIFPTSSTSTTLPASGNWKTTVLFPSGLAIGYGMLSSLWHCCKMWAFGDYFYFFVVKIFVLGPMIYFVFGYCRPLFALRIGTTGAIVACAFLIGALTPWHTFSFQVTYAIFGVLLWFMTNKTGGWFSAFLTMYLSYITHALFSWRGDFETRYVVIPFAVVVLAIVAFASFPQKSNDQFLSS